MNGRALSLLVAGGLVAGGAVWSTGVEGSAAPATEPAPAVVASGGDLFLAKGCAVCHTGPDSRSPFGAGPSLRDAPRWAGTREPGLSAEQYVTQSILDPNAFVSPIASNGDRMPTIATTAAEVDALVVHLLGG